MRHAIRFVLPALLTLVVAAMLPARARAGFGAATTFDLTGTWEGSYTCTRTGTDDPAVVACPATCEAPPT